nr:Uncharacterised protein [Enterobacter mori]
MYKDRSRKSITGLPFIQPRLYPLAQTRITKPVQHKQCSLDAPNLSQRFGKPILFWVSVQPLPSVILVAGSLG